MIIFIYVILLFLILRFSVTIFNFLSNPKLGKYGKHFTDKVSIIIDASQSHECLISLLDSIVHQDYQNYDVIIGNSELLLNREAIERFLKGHEAFRFADPSASPLNSLAKQTDGDYLLFLNPYTTIHNGFINSMLYRTKVFDLALLSIIPSQALNNFKQSIFLPLNDFLLLNLIPLRLVRLFQSPAFALASDKCLFFNASIYRNYEWQAGREAVRAVKLDSFKAETLLGDRLIRFSLPANTTGLLKSAGRNLLLNFGNNSIAALFYLTLVFVGPLFMLLNYEYALLILPVGLIFLTRVMISFLVRQNPLKNIILHPLQMLILFIALLNAVILKILTLTKDKN